HTGLQRRGRALLCGHVLRMSLRPRTPRGVGWQPSSATASVLGWARSKAQQLLRRGEKPEVSQSTGDTPLASWADLYQHDMVAGFVRFVPGQEHAGRAITVSPLVEDMTRQPTRQPGIATGAQFVLDVRIRGNELEPSRTEPE